MTIKNSPEEIYHKIAMADKKGYYFHMIFRSKIELVCDLDFYLEAYHQ